MHNRETRRALARIDYEREREAAEIDENLIGGKDNTPDALPWPLEPPPCDDCEPTPEPTKEALCLDCLSAIQEMIVALYLYDGDNTTPCVVCGASLERSHTVVRWYIVSAQSPRFVITPKGQHALYDGEK
jgi:hypothetical protein